MTKSDLELALFNFRAAAQRYDKPERYYRGDHDLAFATEKFENTFGDLFREFALNLCPSICDAVRDKLKITGFSLGAQAPLPASVASDADSSRRLAVPGAQSRDPRPANDAIWSDNQMDLSAEEIHLEALKLGDSYAIVWPDENGRATIYPQRAAFCTVVYDEERPGRVRFAAKYWRTPDDCLRLNLFYPDRIEKYISKTQCGLSLPDASEIITAGTRTPLSASVASDADRADAEAIVPNPFGVVPLFHFSNTSEIGTFGKSELAQAIPIQNGLNKSVLDMLVAMEFSAFRQRWVTGLEVEYNDKGEPIPPFKAGLDRLWLSSSADTVFGDFNTSDLDQFLKVKDSFRVDMAGVTGTPLHYFLQNERGFASAEALSRAEARFLAKVRDRQKAFGQTWARLMSFALEVEGFGRGVRLRTLWEDPAPMGERELLENLVLKKKLGITSEQALLEAGYGRSDIARMLNTIRTPPRVRSPSRVRSSHMQKPARK